MKFYVVFNYYLVSLRFKFHGDPCTNVQARVVNARTRPPLRKVHAPEKNQYGHPWETTTAQKSRRLNRLFTGEIDKTLEQVLNNNYY